LSPSKGELPAAPETDAEPVDEASAAAVRETPLIRRLLVFQFKLLLDGLRDVVLSPVSIIAVLYGLLRGGPRPDAPFRALLRFGRETDRWIDLFEDRADHDGRPETSASALFDAVERAVREEYERGGGRAAIEARLRKLRERQHADDPADGQ
jgi:hypothetical protein